MVNSKFDDIYFQKKVHHLQKLRLFIGPSIEHGNLSEDQVHNEKTLRYLIKEVMHIQYRGPKDWIFSLAEYFTSVGEFSGFMNKPLLSFSPTLLFATYIER